MSALSSLTTVSETEAFLAIAALAVPPGLNPYLALEQQLESALSLKASASVTPLLSAASALLAVVTAIFLVGFAIRAKRGTLWVFRVVRVGRENYVLGSLVTNKSGWDCVCSCTLQILVWLSYKRNVQHRLLVYILPWLPGGVAASMALWCLSVTYILHLRTYSSETARVPWYISSTLVNTVGISLPFVLLASTLPFTLKASSSYDSGSKHYAATITVLTEGAQVWSPNTSINVETLHESSVQLLAAIVDLTDATVWLRRTYWSLTAWCGAFTAAFGLVGWLYAKALERSIRDMRSRSRSSASVGVTAFTKTRRWLMAISSCFVISMAAVCAHSAWVGVYCERLMTDAVLTELAIVLPVYTIGLLGLPISIMLLLQARQTGATSAPVTILTLGSAPSASDLSRHYTQLQFNLAAQLPLPNTPFFGLTTHDHAENEAAPFEALELESNTSRSEGIVIKREKEVSVVTLTKNQGFDGFEEVVEDKW